MKEHNFTPSKDFSYPPSQYTRLSIWKSVDKDIGNPFIE